MMMHAKNYDHLLGNLEGMSDALLKAHFGLYQGYVNKTNEIEKKLQDLSSKDSNYSYSEYSELQRRRAVPFNGARLHELFFENLTGQKVEVSPELQTAIEQSYGSIRSYLEDVQAGLLSAHGWLLLCRSQRDGVLRNLVIEEHHRGLLVEQDILLALDGWEHAYAMDYGTAKVHYIDALLARIHWDVVDQRFQASAGRFITQAA
ncbi:MAG: superoxide dismutase [Bdellovibrionia bacterium]